MGHEIYRVQVTREFYPDKCLFREIAEVGFNEFNSIVFALEIQSSLDPKKSVTRLNPNMFEFSDWNYFNFFVYIICESEDDAQNLQELVMNDESYHRAFKV